LQLSICYFLELENSSVDKKIKRKRRTLILSSEIEAVDFFPTIRNRKIFHKETGLDISE
jgi:hypothetical protein